MPVRSAEEVSVHRATKALLATHKDVCDAMGSDDSKAQDMSKAELLQLLLKLKKGVDQFAKDVGNDEQPDIGDMSGETFIIPKPPEKEGKDVASPKHKSKLLGETKGEDKTPATGQDGKTPAASGSKSTGLKARHRRSSSKTPNSAGLTPSGKPIFFLSVEGIDCPSDASPEALSLSMGDPHQGLDPLLISPDEASPLFHATAALKDIKGSAEETASLSSSEEDEEDARIRAEAEKGFDVGSDDTCSDDEEHELDPLRATIHKVASFKLRDI